MSPVRRRGPVLHVVESYGAGTASALHQYVKATPDLSHHLIRRLRPDDDHADDGEYDVFDSVADMAPGFVPAVRSVRRRVVQLSPAVVHGHSSFGGAFARLAARRSKQLIVYTPHCYAMERQDLSTTARTACGAAERILGFNTDVYAACSEREAEISRRLAPRRRHLWVVNVTDASLVCAASRTGEAPLPFVAAVGRLAPQRDPGLFVDVVTRLRAERGPIAARWIGGGPPDVIAGLADAGVEVTGWLPRSAALQMLSEAMLYLHTAAWDGAPMTMLEASALGVPIVARRTPALTACPPDYLADTADQMAACASRTLASPLTRDSNVEMWRHHFEPNTVARQRACLLDAYGFDGREESGTCHASKTT